VSPITGCANAVLTTGDARLACIRRSFPGGSHDQQTQVDYGTSGTATFDDQLVIRADSGEFSAPGDSGSAVFGEDAFLGGLLFAGGEGITIVNRISHVVSLLAVRL